MVLALDPEVAAALEPMASAKADMVPPPVGDVQSRRPMLEAIMAKPQRHNPRPRM